MKTKENIINRRGKASISSLNLKKVAMMFFCFIGAMIGITIWAVLKPILRAIGWIISGVTTIAILYWILTL